MFQFLREGEDHFKCYDTHIVYWDLLIIEGDILRTNFMGIVNRRNDRPYIYIIIDEIDKIS